MAASALALAACPHSDEEKAPAPVRDAPLGSRRCSAEPGRKNPRTPLFSRPFDGDFQLYEQFDHQAPDVTGVMSYCGIEMLGLTRGFDGYEWGLPVGTPVKAVADGEITHAGPEEEFFCQKPGIKKSIDDQISVQVKHSDYLTTYRHLKNVAVKVGDHVTGGQRLGLSGASGCTPEPVLYFGVERAISTKTGKPTPVDPYGWDGPRVDSWPQPSAYLWKDGEAPLLNARLKK
jgi:murein DD-endopeptidase MepM/ murein hydrolase activator NlpD